ncbi:hypothetical protein BTA51_28250 [Hahella sp. CCB-MM4]|uniref:Crp/Fnr family transcriptional regulator n=1 Tax=Hahella sp. (strain CCB-MM4) TaxID=1926491 RepID=UPI000B9AC2CC|nr:Crp/Fnr family transcriptional regulator [Hahella sp. CCB-MM4]OZG70022.1 hypothetical protein BTA51_28250 [Hahella sp. CCB-MM4]
MLCTILQRAIAIPDKQALADIEALFQHRSLKKGQTLLHQGDLWTRAFAIESGLLRMHVIDPNGKEFNKNFHLEGTLICPLTTDMEKKPSLFAVTALENSVIWEAPVIDFRSVLGDYGLWEPLRTRLLERLLNDKLQREYDLLTLDGTSRYQNFCHSQSSLAARIPLAQLASYLGLTDVSLSRIRRGLKRQD